MKNPHAVALGALGGSKSSPAKTRAARRNARKPRKNGKLGGRPRKREK